MHLLLGLLADGRYRAGDVQGGLQAVDEALAKVALGERFWEAEVYLGARRVGGPERRSLGARTAFEQALAVARQQGAHDLEQRAADSLSVRVGDRR